MRGYSYPFGFVLYEEKKVIVGIEDLYSLIKFGAVFVGMAILLSITQILALQIILSILIIICFIKIFYYETSEWHGIEHKLIYLLENDCSLTINNFRKVPIKHERCGAWNKFLREPSLKKIEMAIEARTKYLNNQ